MSTIDIRGQIDILDGYKFTIEENTPVEEEIALDPELLGKVFENLLASYNPETKTTARKQTGSFFTPREIVNYMVDESLVAYLEQQMKDHISELKEMDSLNEVLREVFSYTEKEHPFNDNEVNILISALDNIKILDPACGSGAFLMGMLQKLLHLLRKIDPENKQWFEKVIAKFPAYLQNEMRNKLQQENWDYVRKLGIIQECIYGIDIQPIAIQIAKLRFFISLLVDQKEKPGEENRGFEPLPNLDFKLVTANTLIGLPQQYATKQNELNFSDKYFDQFDKLTEEYFSAYLPNQKKDKKNEIIALVKSKCDENLQRIKNLSTHHDERFNEYIKVKNKNWIQELGNEEKLWKSYLNLFKQESVGFFETRYFFPKVKDGFDVVIGNPPYNEISEKKNKLFFQEKYKMVLSGHYDLYIFFFKKGIDLLKSNGINCFITPHTFTIYSQFESLRKWLYNNTAILEITDRIESIFASAVVDNSISLLLRSTELKRTKFSNYRYDGNQLFLMSRNILNKDDFDYSTFDIKAIENKKILSKFQKNTKPLGELVDSCQGITVYAKVQGEKKNYFRQKKETKKSKPVTKGREIFRYKIEWSGTYIEYGDWLWCPRDKNYFESPKIFLRQTSDKLIATYIEEPFYCIDSVHSLIESNQKFNLKFLLGILNSTLGNYLYNLLISEGGKVFAQVKLTFLRKIPIYKTSNDLVIKLVEYLLQSNKLKNLDLDCTSNLISFFERLIDAMVYELYFSEEIKAADAEVLKHLTHLPELEDGWSDNQKLQTIEKVYQELSDPGHPVSMAMEKIKTVPEVRIIEGLDKE